MRELANLIFCHVREMQGRSRSFISRSYDAEIFISQLSNRPRSSPSFKPHSYSCPYILDHYWPLTKIIASLRLPEALLSIYEISDPNGSSLSLSQFLFLFLFFSLAKSVLFQTSTPHAFLSKATLPPHHRSSDIGFHHRNLPSCPK